MVRVLRYILPLVFGSAVALGLILAMMGLIANPDADLSQERDTIQMNFAQVPDLDKAKKRSRALPDKPEPEQVPQDTADTVEVSASTQAATPSVVKPSMFNVGAGSVAAGFNTGSGLGAQDLQINPDQYAQAAALVKVAPQYPMRARMDKIEGKVTVEFTITKKGTVADPKVVSADPEGIFDQAAINAVKQWRYKPYVVDGEPIRVPGATVTIDFSLNQGNRRG